QTPSRESFSAARGPRVRVCQAITVADVGAAAITASAGWGVRGAPRRRGLVVRSVKMGLATWGCAGLLSVRGFPVGVAVCGALEDVRGRRDLGLGGLQDGVLSWSGPGGECRAEVAVVGVFGGDHLALPV